MKTEQSSKTQDDGNGNNYRFRRRLFKKSHRNEDYWLKRQGAIVDEFLKEELKQFEDMKVVFV